MQSRFARWIRVSTPRSREIVLDILNSSHPTALPIQQIYHRALKEYTQDKVPVPQPLPNPRLGAPTVNKRSTSTKGRKVREWKPPPDPPHPDHPIRSLKYLKSVVLADLAQRNEIAKVHSMREPTPDELARKNERSSKASKRHKGTDGPPQPPIVLNVKGMIDQWGWTIKTPDRLEQEKWDRERIRKAGEGLKALDTKKREKEQRNAFQEKWGHLNVRRQRARVGKLEREEKWAQVLERGREEGRAEIERASV